MVGKGVDRDLALRLEAIRQQHGDTVRVEEIGAVVRALLETMTGDIDGKDLKLFQEVESLASYIHAAKAEIAALRPGEIKDEFIASATDELDAIVGATEAATNEIMDAAEQLETLSPMMDEQVAARLTEITTRIFEACTFQDITGQRITKVVRMLKEIEGRVDSLVKAFGGEVADAPSKKAKDPNVITDEDLLNGPQLPAGAADQAEIDRLLASFD
ncbi:protein phosphatase CheZ [Magnetospirillum moscoviense]|uniref:Chemotaxis protein CheZ n=1 Tax=Magnetospirillum moscoviense TaxID=1437059 RepID=A0A178MDY9_9PROT|nr:protein phosphatase CheZ [Magnetospirillum moscoviense]MBF0327502.1 protein phosphatase CheZ [Alphaproteobacteria bacterium]OAN46235.1 chemotaxis protein CheZ [Magnetospirillum moscoviense]